MVLCYSQKEQWIQRLETNLIVAPPLPTCMILEKSINPYLPHFLKTETFSEDFPTSLPLALPWAPWYSSRRKETAPPVAEENRAGPRALLSSLTRRLVSQRRYYKPGILLMCFILPTLVPWYFWGETFQHSLYVATFLRYALVLNATWLVNSAAHLYGYRPYDKNINPRENILVSLGAAGKSTVPSRTLSSGLQGRY